MDTGLHSLVAIARFHQLPAEPEQLAHQFAEPGKPFSYTQLLSAAKALALRAKRLFPSLNQIKSDTLPAIAKAQDRSYFILARLGEGSAADGEATTRTYLIHDLRESAPRSISQEEFEMGLAKLKWTLQPFIASSLVPPSLWRRRQEWQAGKPPFQYSQSIYALRCVQRHTLP